MIEIRPMKVQELERYNQLHCLEGTMGHIGLERGLVAGYCLYKFDSENKICEIVALVAQDPALLDGVLRAVLFFAMGEGMHSATFPRTLSGQVEEWLIALGFYKDDLHAVCAIETLFVGKRKCATLEV